MRFLFHARSTPCEGVFFLAMVQPGHCFPRRILQRRYWKWLICVLWRAICLRSVSFQKTLGLNRTAHRNAFITTVFKRTGGPLLIDDFKVFFFSFYQQMISVCFLKDLLCEPSARESRDVKTEPRPGSGSPNSEWLKKKWSRERLYFGRLFFFFFLLWKFVLFLFA